MEHRALITSLSSHLLSPRELMHLAKIFSSFAVLSCAFFCFTGYGLCTTNGMQNPPEYDACASSGQSYNLGFSDSIVGGTSLGYRSPTISDSSESVCPDPHPFCFRSALSGINHKEKSLKEASFIDSGRQYGGPFCVGLVQDASNISSLSDYGMFKLHNGGVVSCSLNTREGFSDVLPALQTEGCSKDDLSFCGGSLFQQTTSPSWLKNSEMYKSSSFAGSFTPAIRIEPTVLDWGQNYLYSPSVAFLTVVNTCNDSILTLYEPFSNDLQFYPCHFSEVSLGPSESALICFVFFPRCLGLSSAHLILQTSSGGFIVEAKGYASESPFGIQPLLALEIPPGRRLSKNFSLFNPFDETLFVKDITAWISVSLGHNSVENEANSVEIEAICCIHDSKVSDTLLFPTVSDRLVVKSSQIGSPIVAIKPQRNWEIGPHSSETLMGIDITVGYEGKVFGAFCLHLLRPSQDKSDTIMVPIEAEMASHFGYDTDGIFVSATLDGLVVACDGGETFITICLRNHAPHVFSFVKMLQVSDSELFHIKYVEGLLLFPNTVTQVGIIYCSHLHNNLNDMPSEVSNLQEDCQLVILTNDSASPQIEIPCADILHTCFEHQRLSTIRVQDNSILIKSDNTREGHVKVIETSDVDELVLGNWVSQGTIGGMSVLGDQEVLFPVVQVGRFVSRWITVKNPTQHPVVMQLILNSAEIIDECRGADDLSFPSSSGTFVVDEATTPTKHGFSVPESVMKEAYVHPYGSATLGPIIFYPSKRCGWSGSALIRNNISGVEWMTLKGFGGLLSLALLERSEHVQSVNFDIKMPKHLNLSLIYALLHMKEMSSACSRPLLKEVYAKNTGDLPLEVKAIRVGGRECGLDGFKIHACRGFALEPGESKKLLMSYQTDFTVSMVHRDLELALATGIFLIPMKGSFPYDVLNNCKKSMFWMRMKRSFLGFLFIASLFCFLFCFIFPQTIPLGSCDNLCRNDKSFHTIKRVGKSGLLPCNKRKSMLSVFGKMDHLFCSVGKETSPAMQAACGRFSYGQGKTSEQELPKHLMQTSENHKQSSHLMDSPKERKLPSNADQSSDTMKASQLSNLTLKTGKEKGRRRKKKSHGGKLTALSEVSSSHSGNSTPSSPISPVASAISKCNWPLSPDMEQPPRQAHSLITPVDAWHPDKCQASASASKSEILKPGVPVECCRNNVSSPVVPHSASRSAPSKPVKIPSVGGPPTSLLVSAPSVTILHARAPGSNLGKLKAVQAPKAGAAVADEYTYDIWGDHLSGLHLLAPKNVTCMKSSPAEKNFDSFFVGGPQNIVRKSQEG